MIDTGKLWAATHKNDTLSLMSDSLHYCNADKFLTNPNYQIFKVSPVLSAPGTGGSAIIYGYALFDNQNACWPLTNFSGGTFIETHIPDIAVHFVAFCVIEGRFYGGISAATPKTGHTYTVTLTEEEPVTFKAKITALQ